MKQTPTTSDPVTCLANRDNPNGSILGNRLNNRSRFDMHAVHKTDGTIFQPTPASGRGRPAKYPWEYLEVGDYFKVDFEGITSVKVMISQFKKVGRLHEIDRGPDVGTIKITRKT